MKKKIALHINNFAEWTVIIILLVVCCFLTITSLFYHFEEHTSTIIKDNPLISLFAVFLFLAIIGLLSRLLLSVYRRFPYLDKVLLVITLSWVCGFSYVFVIGAKTLPCSDAKSVYDIAVRMYNGDMGAVVPTGSYLSFHLWRCSCPIPYDVQLLDVFGVQASYFIIPEDCLLGFHNGRSRFSVHLSQKLSDKLLCQWTEPTFASFSDVDELYEPDRSSFALDILYGKCHYYLVDSMNIHQSIVYVLSLFAFIYLLIVKKSKQHLELYHYVLAITIIGGFLFTMIWEGGSRYPLPYLFFLIPYASMVVPSIMDKLTKKRMEK